MSWVSHCDPELAEVERLNGLALPERPARSAEAQLKRERGAVIPAGVRLGIWEAIAQGWWECKGCGARVVGVTVETPEACERCLAERAAGRWVWHEPALAGKEGAR